LHPGDAQHVLQRRRRQAGLLRQLARVRAHRHAPLQGVRLGRAAGVQHARLLPPQEPARAGVGRRRRAHRRRRGGHIEAALLV
jgi:hypothetical protein